MVRREEDERPEAELLSFADDDPSAPTFQDETVATDDNPCWKLLIVDDEDEVHTLTRLVLRNYEFAGKGLHLLSAWSGAGARQIIRDHPDIAIILLDVVMEHEDSGLRLVQYIREELGNKHVRIILRTGQPGQAPEQEVVAQYDINDYKAKTELTSQKLFTTITSGLRSWRDIISLDRSRQGLREVIAGSGALFQGHCVRAFSLAALEHLAQLMARGQGHLFGEGDTGCVGAVSGLVALRRNDGFAGLSGCGAYQDCEGKPLAEIVTPYLQDKVRQVVGLETEFFFDQGFVSCVRAEPGQELVFLLSGGPGISRVERDLVRIYMSNVAMAFHNMNLSQEIIATQKEIILTLGEVVETRSKETANHVMRVGEMAQVLGQLAGLEEDRIAELRLAAPMHDVGKVGIPDAILNKPGALTAAEYDIIKTHTTIGHEIMGKSERRIMKSAATVALQHHERWDGKGYPQGLRGEEIHIFGRITALVDVFDALSSSRIYRRAQQVDDVVDVIRKGRGRQFDRQLVDCFLENLTVFVEIAEAHPDQARPDQALADRPPAAQASPDQTLAGKKAELGRA